MHAITRHSHDLVCNPAGCDCRTVAGILALLVLLGLSVGCASRPAAVNPSPSVESLFAGEARPRPARLESARKAVTRGDTEEAIHNFQASISEDPDSADAAIAEMVDVFLARATARKSERRYTEESAEINHCYTTLLRIKQADAGSSGLSETAREVLFKQLARVHRVGSDRAAAHIKAGYSLWHNSKGTWNDDEGMQASALHFVNLAWSFYPSFTNEGMTNSMYEIWQAMKSELATWQYNEVMQRDRLQLGRAVWER